jgi:hypothetical protein
MQLKKERKKEDKSKRISNALLKRQQVLQSHFEQSNFSVNHPPNHIDLREGEYKSIPTKQDALNLRNHIVLMGIDEKVFIILRELRRPLIASNKSMMHPIIIFTEQQLKPIQHGEQLCEEVYYIQGDRNSHNDLKKLNLSNAYSCIIFPNEDVADTDLLFQYLKLVQIVPDHVFLAVELINHFNLTVLNLKVLKLMDKGEADAINDGDGYLHTAQFKLSKDQLTRQDSMNVKKANTSKSVQSKNAKRFVSRKKKDTEDFEIRGKSDSKMMNGVQFFDFDNQPNSLPIYAAGRAFVASSFDPLLVQCFYTTIAATFFESLVIGQKYQAVFQILVPEHLIGVVYKDVFRTFIARNILILGIYRAPTTQNEATFDYVYTSPDLDTILGDNDRLYVYTNPKRLTDTLEEFTNIAEFERLNMPKVDTGQVNIRVNGTMNVTDRQTSDGRNGKGSPRSAMNWF